MNTRLLSRILVTALICLAACGQNAKAAIFIYKITSVSRPHLFAANIKSFHGYLVYDSVTPGNSQSIEILSAHTYSVGHIASIILPSGINFFSIDRGNHGFPNTEYALVGLQGNGITYAGVYLGASPRLGFRLGTVNFPPGIAKSLRGSGSTTVVATAPGENYTQTQTLTLDVLTANVPAPQTVSDGLTLVGLKRLGSRTQIP